MKPFDRGSGYLDTLQVRHLDNGISGRGHFVTCKYPHAYIFFFNFREPGNQLQQNVGTMQKMVNQTKRSWSNTKLHFFSSKRQKSTKDKVVVMILMLTILQYP